MEAAGTKTKALSGSRGGKTVGAILYFIILQYHRDTQGSIFSVGLITGQKPLPFLAVGFCMLLCTCFHCANA